MSESRESPNESKIPSSGSEAITNSAKARPDLRLLIPTIVLIVFWAVTEASYRLEMGMFYRFLTRMLTLLVFLLFFMAWGFSRRHFTFGQRLFAFVMILGAMFVGGALGHPATGTFATAMMGLPIVLTLSIGWLWMTRRRAATVELAGIGAACVAVFGIISLLRWDGMDGRQRALMSWRWTPSPEEQFLQQTSQPAVARVVEQTVLEETADD